MDGHKIINAELIKVSIMAHSLDSVIIYYVLNINDIQYNLSKRQ